MKSLNLITPLKASKLTPHNKSRPLSKPNNVKNRSKVHPFKSKHIKWLAISMSFRKQNNWLQKKKYPKR